MKIALLGAGAWGTALAIAATPRHEATLGIALGQHPPSERLAVLPGRDARWTPGGLFLSDA